MTTKLKKTSGTFTGTGASAKVHGREVALLRHGGGAGTLQLRMYDPETGVSAVAETLTEDGAKKGVTEQGFDWDVNCSAHTTDMGYTLRVTRE